MFVRYLDNVHNISDYTVKEEVARTKNTVFKECYYSHLSEPLLIKKFKKDQKKLYQNEISAYNNVMSNAILPIRSIFSTETEDYIVYKNRKFKQLDKLVKENPLSFQLIAKLSRQFYEFLTQCNKQNIFYLEPEPLKTIMLAPEEQIVIGSFESASIGGSESDSIFYQMDKGTSGYTDMLTLGCFIHCLFTGNSPLDYNTKTFKVDSEIPDEVYDLLTNLLATDVEQRKRFSPKEHPFLSYAVEISIAKNFFSIDHVFVDWNDGFKAGFYNSEMTFKDGISFVSDSTVITFNDKELCFTSEDQILCLKEGELQLGCEYATYCLRDNLVLGNTSQDGSIQFTSESFYYTLGKQRVKIASDGVTTFYSNKPVIDDDKLLTDSAVKLKVLPNGITSTINRTDVTISKNGVKLILGSSEIILQPRGESLYVIFGTCSVYLSANEFNVHIGNYQISVNKEGVLNIISDKTIFVVNNKEVSVTNNGQPFNLNNFGVKVPNINIKLPKAKIPVPPKMFDSPNPSPASQRKFSIADYLFEGEEVILESNILKKAIFASDKMIAILTSYKRIIVLKQEYKGFKSEFKLPNSFGTKVSKTKLEIDTVKKKKIYNFLDEETAKQWAEKVSQFSQKKK